MRTIVNLIIDIFNFLHEFFIEILEINGIVLGDKQMHFIILGLAFLILFIVVEYFFKKIAVLSISYIAFIYIFTVSVVVALAIEVGQYQSKSGQMDFLDVTWGLYGVIVFIFVFALIRGILSFIYRRFIKKEGYNEIV